MLNPFLAFSEKHFPSLGRSSTLLAVSGGVDSVVMVHLFHQAGFDFAIAHVNYQLRGEASEQDEVVAEELAKSLDVPFYHTRFSTLALKEESNKGLQELARDLRYNWLEEIRKDIDFDLIATAHHANDLMETMLLNLVKGTGIKGLRGIQPTVGRIIRPLLFATKLELLAYANEHNLSWREDDSNQKDHYQRNQIRLNVVPELKKINPSLEKALKRTAENLSEVEYIFEHGMQQILFQLILNDGETQTLDVLQLLTFSAHQTILYHWLHPFQFNRDQIVQLVDSIKANHPGKQFVSPTHILYLDRNELILKAKSVDSQTDSFKVSRDQTKLQTGRFTLSFQKVSPEQVKHDNDQIAHLDMGKIRFPLTVRKWKQGDRFSPYGMNGKTQLVSDYLINNKVSLSDKKDTWVILSGQAICWLVGHRTSHFFQTDEMTTTALRISLKRDA